jgi:putative ABC transport system ATP-binding protein
VRVGGDAPPARGARRWWVDARRTSVAVVHQRLNLLPTLTARDNVALPLRLDGWSRAAARAEADGRLAAVGAADLADLRADVLSSGQQQLVAVARGVAGGRRLLLADEPTAALDTVAAERVVELLAGLAAGGLGVLLVTHDSRLAAWADRVVVLRDGRAVDTVTAEPGPTAPPAAVTP